MGRFGFLRFFYVACLAGILLACSDEDNNTTAPTEDLYFFLSEYDVFTGEELTPVVIRKSDGTAYDNSRNSSKLTWLVNDPDIAELGTGGSIKGLKPGSTVLTIRSESGSNLAKTKINVLASGKVSGTSLSPSLIYSKGVELHNNSVMQCFDILEEGSMYYSQIGRGTSNHNLYIMTGRPNSPIDAVMTLPFFGHGTNIAVERDASGNYLWVGNYANRASDNAYTNSQTVARIAFQGGRTMYPGDASDNYYIPSCRNLNPALDEDNDILAILAHPGVGTSRNAYIYSLSEAMEVPVSTVTLAHNITSGGGNSSAEETTGKPTIEAHDLSKLNMISTFAIPTTSTDLGNHSFQGFDIQNGKIYFYEGDVDASEKSTAYFNVLDMMSGKLLLREKVQAIDDSGLLASLGLTTTGFMEAEGIKIKGSKLYLGFASKSADDIRRAVVLCYDLSVE